MPELSVTEEQLERLETVRSELEAAFLDGYGHMRRHDAVEYLLDTYTPPAERTTTAPTGTTGATTAEPGDEGAGEPDDAATGAADDAPDLEGRVRAALDREVRDEDGGIDYPTLQSVARNTEGVKGSGTSADEMYEALVEAKVGELGAGETDEVDFDVDGEERVETDDTDGTDDTDDTGAVDGDDADDSGDSESGANEEGSTGATGAPGGGGGSQLQAMMNLLRTHDDKWRKASSGDAPYEVDLPDGGTESARTKDDVKRILFTNY